MAWTAPTTRATADLITASIWNTDIVNNLLFLSPVVQSYVPPWTGSITNPVINNGTITGRYVQVAKGVTGMINVTAGSTTTFGSGAFLFGLPVAANAALVSNHAAGSSIVVDSSANQLYTSTTVMVTATTIGCSQHGGGGGAQLGLINAANPVAFATGDQVLISFVYEAA